MTFVESYHLHPKLIEALAARVKAGLAPLIKRAYEGAVQCPQPAGKIVR